MGSRIFGRKFQATGGWPRTRESNAPAGLRVAQRPTEWNDRSKRVKSNCAGDLTRRPESILDPDTRVQRTPRTGAMQPSRPRAAAPSSPQFFCSVDFSVGRSRRVTLDGRLPLRAVAAGMVGIAYFIRV